MASFRKRNNQWEAQVRRVGHPAKSQQFITYREARAWARSVEADEKRHEKKPDIAPQFHTVTLADLLIRYELDMTAQKKGAVQERYKLQALRRHRVAQKPLEDLTSVDLARLRDERLKEVEPGTVRRELAILRHCFEIARKEWGYQTIQNPVALIRLPPPGKARTRRLSSDEMSRLRTALAASRSQFFAPLVLMAIETGMRQGELLSLTWNDIDFVGQLAHLEETKNGNSRSVPLSPAASSILISLQDDTKLDRADRVFRTTRHAVQQSWATLMRRAELIDFRFHDLRHEAISRFFEMGLTIPEVALISGHKDVRMLFRYTHLKPTDVVQKLGNASFS